VKVNSLVIGHWYMFSRFWKGADMAYRYYSSYCQYEHRRHVLKVGHTVGHEFGFRFIDGPKNYYCEVNIEQWMEPCSESFSDYLNLFCEKAV